MKTDDVYALAAEWVRMSVPIDEMTEAHHAAQQAYATALAQRLNIDAEWIRTRATKHLDAEGRVFEGDVNNAETQGYRIELRLVFAQPGKEDNDDFEKWTARAVTIYRDGTVVVAENPFVKAMRAFLQSKVLAGESTESDKLCATKLEAADVYHTNFLPAELQVPLATYLP